MSDKNESPTAMLVRTICTILLLIPCAACFVGAAYLAYTPEVRFHDLWGWLVFAGFLLMSLPSVINKNWS